MVTNSTIVNKLNTMNIGNYNNFIMYRKQVSREEINFIFFNATSWSSTSQSLSFNGSYISCSYEPAFNAIYGGNTVYTASTGSILAEGSYQSNQLNQENNLKGMMYITTEQAVYPNTFVGMQAMGPNYEYLIFINDLTNTAYNGNILTYYFQGDFYSYSQAKIGNIQPNDSYYFELRLKDSVTGIVKGTSFVSLNTDPINIYNDGAIFVNENFDVYIVNRLLKYSTQYQLEIVSYYGDGGDNLYEDIDWFMFLPSNAVVSGDYILSFGSGDFTQQDSVNTIIETITGYQEPSGDIAAFFGDYNVLSGDILEGISMPKVAHSDDLTIFNLVRVFGETLTYSGDAYFDFSLHGEPPTRIYASQFTTPNNALKVFMSSFLVFGTFYMIMLQIRNFIELLSTANIKSAIDYIDTSLDKMFYM